MKKQILAKNERLRADASKLLQKLDLVRLLEKNGWVKFTGSYAANLMNRSDIDVYVVGSWSREKVTRIFVSLLGQLRVKGLLFFDWVKYRHPDFPKAYYIGVKDNFRGEKWKIDIWFLTDPQVKALPFGSWEGLEVSDAQRELIVRFKDYRDRHQLVIPSFRIYVAVLFERLGPIKEIRSYCLNQTKKRP